MGTETHTLLLNIVIFTPLVGVILIALLGAKQSKWVALLTTLIPLGITLQLFSLMGEATAENHDYLGFASLSWFSQPDIDIKYIIGMDGTSGLMGLLTVILFPLIVGYMWTRNLQQSKLFYMMLLLLQTGVLGFFFSLDLLVFYVFFELVLIPGSFLIGIWGDENRGKASLKFFIYTLVGSLVMLIAILYMGIHAATLKEGITFTTDYFLIQEAIEGGKIPELAGSAQAWLLAAFAISFAIKAPLFPFHTWQPSAYASSSIGGSVVLAGVLSKMGAYGFVRFCLPLFPEAVPDAAPLLATLAVIGIIYGAYMAVIQTDIKRLIAFSSLSHMGFIILGIFAMTEEALDGAILQMFAHGVSTAAMFLLADMVEVRFGTRDIRDLGGIAALAPVFTTMFLISTMASVGLPGLSGFVGEFLIMVGAFDSGILSPTLAIVAAVGVILAAIYLLNMFRKVMFGPRPDGSTQTFPPLAVNEWSVMLPLLILMFWIGLYATPFLEII
ncbi:MAG: NADH-quinone oxidoreductase subunit M [Bacteroidota bacterium]